MFTGRFFYTNIQFLDFIVNYIELDSLVDFVLYSVGLYSLVNFVLYQVGLYSLVDFVLYFQEDSVLYSVGRNSMVCVSHILSLVGGWVRKGTQYCRWSRS